MGLLALQGLPKSTLGPNLSTKTPQSSNMTSPRSNVQPLANGGYSSTQQHFEKTIVQFFYITIQISGRWLVRGLAAWPHCWSDVWSYPWPHGWLQPVESMHSVDCLASIGFHALQGLIGFQGFHGIHALQTMHSMDSLRFMVSMVRMNSMETMDSNPWNPWMPWTPRIPWFP